MRNRIGDGFDGCHLTSQIGKTHRFDRERTNGRSRECLAWNRVVKSSCGPDRKHTEEAKRNQIGASDAATAHLGQTPRASEVDDAFAKASQFFTDNKLRGHLRGESEPTVLFDVHFARLHQTKLTF